MNKDSSLAITKPVSQGTNVVSVQITRKPLYHVIVGFEVNYPEAFKDGIQDTEIDYGHAFFYMTRDNIVELFFSFGPAGLAEPGKITTPYTGSRPANTEYKITEVTQLFRQKITEEQARGVQKAHNEFKVKVAVGKETYYVLMNDTCAETARDILLAGGVSTPKGDSPVKGGGYDNVTTNLNFVNPYAWYNNYLSAVMNQNATFSIEKPKEYYGPGGRSNLAIDSVHLTYKWILQKGEACPFFNLR